MSPTGAQREAIAALADAAGAVDGVGPYSEQSRLALAGGLPATHLLRTEGEEVLAYAQLWVDGSAELAVHPDHRRRGHGRALLAQARAAGAERFWSYAGHAAVPVLAKEFDLHPVRELWRMRAPLPLDPDPPPELPAGVAVRTFEVGRDEEAWLACNAAAFVGHAEQGRLTRAELDARIASDWFDPAGFFLAERGEALVGFHWTKTHPDAGEIYVLGVDPAAHGGGLGKALTRIGLRHLATRGFATALLYVDAANGPAVSVYRRMGFEVESASVLYGP
ncbi:MAG: mycothiol synthase [Sporichthyaceae bacterium]